MSINRIDHKENFVVVDKEYLNDKNLSNSAKGLLTIMLSMKDDWQFKRKHLVSLSADGITKIDTALKELKKLGYLNMERTKNNNGHFMYIYHVHERKKLNGTNNI